MGNKQFGATVTISAIDRLSRVIDRVKNKFPELANKSRQATAAFEALDKSTKKWAGALERVGSGFTKAGQALTVGITLPVVAAGAYAIKAFADYETALIGVGKTSDIQGAALQKLGMDFVDMSKRIPVSAVELMELGKTAAQLGVRGEPQILKFSETLAKLATATNIVGEEGATDLARFMKITSTNMNDVDKVGSALVALGNTSAATESEILSFSTRLASTTALYGFSASQTLGYAAAMKSLGIEAEAGSSAVQRALGDLNNAISKGGQKAQIISKLTGIPLEKLKEAFKEDAAGVLRDFAAGLGKVAERGGDVTQALQYFGMDGVRDIAVMGTLAKKTSELDQAMRTAKKGIEENTALNKEFQAAIDSLNSRFQLTKNRVNALFISLGARLAPAVNFVLDAFNGLISFLENNPTLATTLAVFAGILAILGPLFLAIGGLITAFITITSVVGILNAVMGILGITMWGVLAPVLLLMAKFLLIVAVIALVSYGIYKLGSYIWDLVGGWDGITAAVGNATAKINGAIDAMKRFVGLKSEEGGGGPDWTASVGKAQGAAAMGPQGAPIGGTEAKAQANQEFQTRTNNAHVTVDVRAPQSTRVRSESDGGGFTLNRGLVGAF